MVVYPFFRSHETMMRNQKEIPKIIKYSTIGAINTAITYLSYTLLVKFGFPIYWSLAIGFSVGMISSYLGNSRWTFTNAKKTKIEFYKFLIINAIVLFLSEISLHFINIMTTSNFYITELINIPPMLIFGFFMNQYIVFNGGKHHEKRTART